MVRLSQAHRIKGDSKTSVAYAAFRHSIVKAEADPSLRIKSLITIILFHLNIKLLQNKFVFHKFYFLICFFNMFIYFGLRASYFFWSNQNYEK